MQILGFSSGSLNQNLQDGGLGTATSFCQAVGLEIIGLRGTCLYDTGLCYCVPFQWYCSVLSMLFVSMYVDLPFLCASQTCCTMIHKVGAQHILEDWSYRNLEGMAGLLLATKSLRSTGPKRRPFWHILSILSLRFQGWGLSSGLWLVPQWSTALWSLGSRGCPQNRPSGGPSSHMHGADR